MATKWSRLKKGIDTPSARRKMPQRRAATGSARNKSARHVTTAHGAAVSSNSTFKSILPQKTSAASNVTPNAIFARLVHRRRRAGTLSASRTGALDSIRAGSYQSFVCWAGEAVSRHPDLHKESVQDQRDSDANNPRSRPPPIYRFKFSQIPHPEKSRRTDWSFSKFGLR